VVDAHANIRAYLLTVSAITALTSTRIYVSAAFVAPKGYHPTQGGAIVFKMRGGESAVRNSHVHPSMQFKCYGLTELAASALGRALYDAFNDVGNQYFKSAEVEVLGQLLEEPDTGWVFDLSFYRFWMPN
jgi:hypothetical protein